MERKGRGRGRGVGKRAEKDMKRRILQGLRGSDLMGIEGEGKGSKKSG